MTNYDKLILDVTTDGTVSPEDAFSQAANILVEQFQSLQRGFDSEEVVGDAKVVPDAATPEPSEEPTDE